MIPKHNSDNVTALLFSAFSGGIHFLKNYSPNGNKKKFELASSFSLYICLYIMSHIPDVSLAYILSYMSIVKYTLKHKFKSIKKWYYI